MMIVTKNQRAVSVDITAISIEETFYWFAFIFTKHLAYSIDISLISCQFIQRLYYLTEFVINNVKIMNSEFSIFFKCNLFHRYIFNKNKNERVLFA